MPTNMVSKKRAVPPQRAEQVVAETAGKGSRLTVLTSRTGTDDKEDLSVCA